MEKEDVLFLRNRCNGVEGDVDDHDSVWDDRALLKAYDDALRPIKEEIYQRLGLKSSDMSASEEKVKKSSGKWKEGDACRAIYSEDGKLYEGYIKSINHTSGRCTVKYVGYGNEEEVLMVQLLPSAGLEARTEQEKQATIEEENGDCDSGDGVESEDGKSKPVFGNNPRTDRGPERRQRQRPSLPVNYVPPPSYGMIPPAFVPPPPPLHITSLPANDREALSSMLMSWYMSGFHTGYYQGLQQAKASRSDKRIQD